MAGAHAAGPRRVRPRSAAEPAPRAGVPRPVLLVATLVATALALLVPGTGSGSPGGAAPGPAAGQASGTGAPAGDPAGDPVEVAALSALREWDEARAAAWAAGDVAALARLYAPAAAAGRTDVASLQAYLARGLVVVDLRSQVLEVDVVTRSARSWRLLVTDRLLGGRAVPRSDPEAEGVLLPRDAATAREVVLLRRGGRWVVTDAGPAPP